MVNSIEGDHSINPSSLKFNSYNDKLILGVA